MRRTSAWLPLARRESPAKLAAYFVAAACAAIAFYYSAHSLYLAATLIRPMPMADEWVWLMTDFFPYLDGKYSASKLLTQIAEHRLLTTRLVLFIDAIFFDLRGLFPSTVTYLSLASIAFMLVRLAVQPATVPVQAAAFLILLAITWSTSQYFNLTWSYQVQFPLVHLFALRALWSFAIAVTTEDNVRYAWLALALICDFLAIWSAGSGLFLTASFLLIAIWLGNNRLVAIFFLIHLLIVTHF
jgi:hypothetical protein